ncbi:MAG: pyrroline-5-carboxylate reductase dimerization domain-containing protein, partial [Pseudomonadota bacterium]
MRILMAGCGKMGGALLRRWAAETPHDFVVVDPAGPETPDGVVAHKSIEPLTGQVFDVLIVAVKPQMIEAVAPNYAEVLSSDALVVSMAAGFSIDNLARVFGGRPAARIMPNLPVEIGRGVSGALLGAACGPPHKSFVQALMAPTGALIWLETEDGLDRFTAMAGSGPGYVFEIARLFGAATEALGFSPSEARDMVLATLQGAAELAQQSDRSLEDWRNAVTSKNGVTQAGLDVLMADGALAERLEDVLKAA